MTRDGPLFLPLCHCLEQLVLQIYSPNRLDEEKFMRLGKEKRNIENVTQNVTLKCYGLTHCPPMVYSPDHR